MLFWHFKQFHLSEFFSFQKLFVLLTNFKDEGAVQGGNLDRHGCAAIRALTRSEIFTIICLFSYERSLVSFEKIYNNHIVADNSLSSKSLRQWYNITILVVIITIWKDSFGYWFAVTPLSYIENNKIIIKQKSNQIIDLQSFTVHNIII